MGEFLGFAGSEREARDVIEKDRKRRKLLGIDTSSEKYRVLGWKLNLKNYYQKNPKNLFQMNIVLM